jgi:glutamate synthase (NADPH/NADH) small chain
MNTNGNNKGVVRIIYRRSREEIPARAEEVIHAEEEGVVFDFLTNPVGIIGDSKNNVMKIRCIRMRLEDAGNDKRKKPVPIEGSEFEIEADTIIMALGTSPNPLVFNAVQGLDKTERGTVAADAETGRTTKERVWAGGDIVTGAATVISAMGAGKRAAADINLYLNNRR